mgnify:CR=1 FL=1
MWTCYSMFGCSGPGAAKAIEAAVTLGYVSAALSLPLGLAAGWTYLVGRNNLRACCLNLAPFAIHPAWTVSATKGDCGSMKMLGSTIWLMLAIGLLGTAVCVCLCRGWIRSDQRCRYTLGQLMAATMGLAVFLALGQTLGASWVSWLALAVLLMTAMVSRPQHRLPYRPAQ